MSNMLISHLKSVQLLPTKLNGVIIALLQLYAQDFDIFERSTDQKKRGAFKKCKTSWKT